MTRTNGQVHATETAGARSIGFTYLETVAIWRGGEFMSPMLGRDEREIRCFACGGALEEELRLAGSLRCHACREIDAPIDPAFVARD